MKPLTIFMVMIAIALVAGAAFLTIPQVAGKISAGSGEVSTQCTTSQYAYNETAAGYFLCAQVTLSQLGGTSSCPANQYAIEIGSSVTCAQINWSQLGATPQLVYNLTQGSHTVSGKVTFLNSTTIGIEVSGQTFTWKLLSTPWSLISGFPSGCPAGEFVTQVGSALTCSVPTFTELSTQCTTGQYAYNETKAGDFLCAQVQLSQLGGSSSCTAGQYAIEIASSISCSQVAWTQVSGKPQVVYNITEGSKTITGKVTFVNTTTVGVWLDGQDIKFTVLSTPWSLLGSFPSGCSSGYFVTAVGTTLTCTQVAWTQLTSFPTGCSAGSYVTTIGSTLTCTAAVSSIAQGSQTPVKGAVVFVNTTTIGIEVKGQDVYFDVLSVPWSSLTSFPSACGTNTFATAIGASITCTSVAWAALSSFPSGCSSNQFVTTIGTTLTCSSAVVSITGNGHSTTGALVFTNSTSIGIDVSGQTIYFKLLSQSCSSNQYVTTVANSITCAQPSYTALSNYPTACSSGYFVTGVASTLACTQVAWSNLITFPSGCTTNKFITTLATTPTCAPAITSTSTLNYGLVGYWPLDEGSGTSAYDLSGSGNTGTLVNSPTWVTGKFGDALSFVRSSIQYVNINSAGFPTGSNDRSIFAWVRTTDSGDPLCILAYGISSSYKSYALFLNGVSSDSLFVGDVFNSNAYYSASGTITDGNWHFVGAVLASGTVTLYLDGLQIGSPTSLVGLNTVLSTARIGAFLETKTSPSRPFNGNIDNPEVWNRALSASEVLNLYNSEPTYPLITVLPVVSIAKSTITAGASVWTYTDNDGYNEQMILSTVGAISAETCNGVTGYPIVAGTDCILAPGATMVITWAVTAPVYTKVPFT